MQSASSEAEQFFDASSHVASSVSSLSRDNSLTAALPHFSAMSAGPVSDGAQLDVAADDQGPADSTASEAPPVTAEPSEAQSVIAAPSSIPTIPDDPSIDPLEGDAMPLGNLSPLSGDPQLWWNSGHANPDVEAATSTPVEAGEASLVSLADAGGTSAPASDPFTAAAAEPVLDLDNGDSDPWGMDKAGKEASDTDAAETTLAATTHLFGGLQTGDNDDEDEKSGPEKPEAAELAVSSTGAVVPEAGSKGVEAASTNAPNSSSPPSAPSSPRAEASQPSTAASSPPAAFFNCPFAAGTKATDSKKSVLAAESSGEAGGRPARLPVSVPASANERTSSDWLPVRPPVATGASHVTPSPARAARGAASGTMPTGMAGSAAADSLRHPDDDSMAWLRSKSRHYFIISNGGRPIYTRHGQPNDAAAIAALLFGLASLSHDALGEMPHTFRAGGLTLAMRAKRVKPESPRAPRSPSFTLQPYSNPRQNGTGASGHALGNVAMITACSCTEPLPESVLQVHLELLQLQLLVWTSGKYERVLVDNPTLDTTAALSGTDASFEGLLERLGNTMDFLLQAVETLRIRPILRGAAEAALRQAIVDCNGVFGVVACGHQLVAQVSHPQLASSHRPHAWDVLLLLNFVISNSSYRTQLSGQQAWVPFCLPKSSPHCFHFVYVHHPKQESPLYVALVCRSQQDFFSAHSVREPLMSTLCSTGVIEEAEHNACTSPLSHRMPIADIPLPDQLRHVQGALWHFAVVRCELNTFTQTTFTPLASEKDQQAAMQDCMRLHASMWSSAAVTKSHDPLPVQWRVGAKWAILGVIERGQYEAFAVLDPLTQKTEAMALFNHVLAYLLDNPECWPQDQQPKVTEGSGFWSSTTPDSIRTRTL